MTSIVICEKPSQAKDITAAVGTRFGKVLPAQGHLLVLEDPEEVNPDWKRWGYDVLIPPSGLFKTKPVTSERDGASKLRAIRDALKNADRVVVATDCDREGQLIGDEILTHYKFKGEVLRALFTAQDEKTLRKAFDNLEPNAKYESLYQAAMARQQADQIFNLTLTRAATVALRPPGEKGAIGIGRVKTPTMAIVCRRELEIRNFKPVDYFEIATVCAVQAGKFPLRHGPKGEDERIFDKAEADRIAALARDFTGPLSVKTEAKRKAPPRLFDLPGLQKAASSRWGWGASKTLEVAQALYAERKVTTYPRAETRYLAENQIADVDEIVSGLTALPQFADVDVGSPTIRKGKAGHFSDAGLAGVSHHAVIPNVNAPGGLAAAAARLGGDERRLFDLIASAYLAAVMPDYEYRQTKVSMRVPDGSSARLFTSTGAIPSKMGWKAVFQDVEDEEEQGSPFPAMIDGERGRLTDAVVEAKQTKAPPRYTEGGLIEAMQNAWKFVVDKGLQDRLKDAKGIGTPATRADVIDGLKRQGFIAIKGKTFVATEKGLSLYGVLLDAAPALVDPGTTAQWEMRLDDVVLGKEQRDTVISDVAAAARDLVEALRAKKVPGGGGSTGGKPTAPMLKAVQGIQRRLKIMAPPAVLTDFEDCKAFLDQHMTKGPFPPSEKQAALVRKLEKEKGESAPEGWERDSKIASAFIDTQLGGGSSKPSKKGKGKRPFRKRG